MTKKPEKVREIIDHIGQTLGYDAAAKIAIVDAIEEVRGLDEFTVTEADKLNGLGLHATELLTDEEGNFPAGLSGEQAITKIVKRLEKIAKNNDTESE